MANLTTKELSGIEDSLKSEQNLICKCYMYAKETNDPILRSKFEQIGNKHQEHYDKLCSLLG